MKVIKNWFSLYAFVLVILLTACSTTGAATPLPTAVPTATIPTPTPAPTAVPTATIPAPTPAPTAIAPATAVVLPTIEPPFSDQVVNAFNTADYNWINAHMGSEFTFAGWQAGGSALPPAAAVDQLKTVYFSSGSQPVFQLNADTTALLGGVDPLSLWGPDVTATDALYVTGLGSSAQDEVLLILASYDDGTPYISCLLSAFGGFAAYPTIKPPFSDQVVNAFNTADYDWINAHMGSEFTFAGWQAGGSALPPAAAVDQLKTVYFGSGSQPVFQLNADTTALLGGVDPLSLWGPDVTATDALYVTGLGSSAQDEVLLILASYDDGTPYISGLLSAFGGFAAYPTVNQ